jgi:hypothetical protein
MPFPPFFTKHAKIEGLPTIAPCYSVMVSGFRAAVKGGTIDEPISVGVVRMGGGRQMCHNLLRFGKNLGKGMLRPSFLGNRVFSPLLLQSLQPNAAGTATKFDFEKRLRSFPQS